MARPRNTLFYETPLPDFLPPEKEWLRDYHKNSRKVLEYIVRNGAKSTAYHGAIKALTLFREHLLQNGGCFSSADASRWCTENAPLTKGYEITIKRLLDFYQYGSVQPIHAFPYVIQYCAHLSEYWLGLLEDFSLSLKDKGDKKYQDYIRNAAARFLYGLQILGISDISQITFSVLEEYCDRDQHRSHNEDARYTYIIGDFLHLMAEQGLCPYGLGWYPYFRMTGHILRFSDLSAEQKGRVESVRSESLEFPADEYACLIPDFLKELQSYGYSKSPMKSSRFTLYNLLLFLQMHDLGYHHEAAEVWTECARERWQHTGWKQSRRTLFLFNLFLEQNAVVPQTIYRSKGLRYESLPKWCRLELELFIEQKHKEGWEPSTVCMFRSSVTRFCEYLVSAGLDSFSELNAVTVKQFNQDDLHQTEEGKNAYNGRIRKFLEYLERKGIVPYGIHLSLYAKSAPKERIVTVLGEQEETAIINAGKSAVSPLELRDNAILLIGLRMGFRASDVINLKLSDINWDKQSIRIIQDKTDREIEVPMPVEVGNAIYRYLKFGRHASESPNVFIKDRAPYDSVQRGTCLRALFKVVPSREGAGYHITRRTFATKRLRSNTGRQTIADLLGHSDTTSLHHYLLLDEERMRLCPISMEDAGIVPEGDTCMTEIRNYTYTSILAPYMEGFIAEKRSLGFIYNSEAYELFRLDAYWNEKGFSDPCMSFEMLDEWLRAKPWEGKASHCRRVSATRLLAVYMNTLGIPAYAPLFKVGKDHNRVHIFSREEIKEIFRVIDRYVPNSINQADFRMAKEYPMLFRLYYCCGMRNNEACALETKDVDLAAGIITIRNGKNQKDRLIYLPDDLRKMAASYYRYLCHELGYSPRWFFPGRFPDRHVGKGQIDKRFRAFWAETASSAYCDKRPTPHCFRHAFVVNRINMWIEAGMDLDVMLPYLSKYLGHTDPQETFYYYHMVSDAFRILKGKDKSSSDVIPEVRRR